MLELIMLFQWITREGRAKLLWLLTGLLISVSVLGNGVSTGRITTRYAIQSTPFTQSAITTTLWIMTTAALTFSLHLLKQTTPVKQDTTLGRFLLTITYTTLFLILQATLYSSGLIIGRLQH